MPLLGYAPQMRHQTLRLNVFHILAQANNSGPDSFPWAPPSSSASPSPLLAQSMVTGAPHPLPSSVAVITAHRTHSFSPGSPTRSSSSSPSTTSPSTANVHRWPEAANGTNSEHGAKASASRNQHTNSEIHTSSNSLTNSPYPSLS